MKVQSGDGEKMEMTRGEGVDDGGEAEHCRMKRWGLKGGHGIHRCCVGNGLGMFGAV